MNGDDADADVDVGEHRESPEADESESQRDLRRKGQHNDDY